MKRISLFLLVVSTFLFSSGCAAAKLVSVAGKAGKAGSVAAKAGSTAMKAGSTAAKAGSAASKAGAIGKGAAVVALTQADDVVRLGRMAQHADSVILVGTELPKAGKAVSRMEPSLVDSFLTGLDVADLFFNAGDSDGSEYHIGEGGPTGMRDAFMSFPSTIAISPTMQVEERFWAQWLRRPEGDRLGVFDAKNNKVALLKPQVK